MKQKDVITGWLVAFIISCMMLTGCTEKAKKPENKIMKVYKVKVNGKVYEVELESVSEKAGNIAAPAAPAQAAAPQAAPQPVASGAGNEQKAPMAGTILDVKVSVGQQVNAGDVLFILEAMKLENEVVAEFSGVVKSIAVAKGASVQNGQVLVVIG